MSFKSRTGKIFSALTLTLSLLGAPIAQADTTLRIGNQGEPASLDPHFLSGDWENRIAGDLFMGLTTEDPEGNAIPGAAESWTVSDDGLVYTFKIRDHKWSDGQPVTAQDFEYAMRRILLPETAAEYASLLYIIKNGEELNTGKAKPEDLGVHALDDKTLEITLKGPAPFLISMLTHYTAFPVPKHIVEKYGKDWTKKEHIATNGPYKLVEWLPNTHVKVTKNELFWDAANVKIDNVIFYPQEDAAALIKRMRAGEIDCIYKFPSGQIDWLRQNMPEETKIAPYLGTYYYPINTKRAPFTDKRIRQALSMAIDREIIMDKVLKTGELPAYSMVPPGTSNYKEPSYVTWKSMPMADRITKAKELMKEAGYGDDKHLKVQLRYNTDDNHKRIAIAVAQMWKKIGVETELFNSEVKVHYAELKQGNFEVARAGWVADYNDPQNFLFLLESTSKSLNYGNYDNPEYDKLMEDAYLESDLKKRAQIMGKAEAIAMEDAPIIPIYYYVSKNLVSTKIKGWKDAINDTHRTRWLSIEK
ncbi:peptide ABC transporter substrate-binding protein [Hahella sp. CR1]|uniref:peptide ABC transporter substrate-binding protein n=1 Tax=Hahella sp. CR1 TaxID=2992807 RepID=UPI0024419ECD|nr:peptide ABC transporter substrate-binding protein [Hahella sp. CR1]MDG9668860.1 peptide ABC transporter substrate-binding protein [Hahella sp. CR1]